MKIKFKECGFLTWVSGRGHSKNVTIEKNEVFDIEMVEDTNDGTILTDYNGFQAIVNGSNIERVV